MSLQSEALVNLPRPQFNAGELIENFAAKGLSVDDMVALSGNNYSIGCNKASIHGKDIWGDEQVPAAACMQAAG